MKITDAARLIDEFQSYAEKRLGGAGLVITRTTEDEKDKNGELEAIVGSVVISAEGKPEPSGHINIVACVEESGEVDDEMLTQELIKLRYTVEDYKERLDEAQDKALALSEIDELITTGIDRREERFSAISRRKIYRIACGIAAALMVGSAIWLLIDMIKGWAA